MTALEILQERNSDIHEIVEEFMPRVVAFLKSGPIPKTTTVFLSFIANTDFIKNGILDVAETENVYAVKILFRSLIEHFLRFQYIWFRICEEKSDTAAEEYLKFSSFKDGLLAGKSWKRVAELLGEDVDITPYDALKNIMPELASHSAKEVSERTAKFQLAKIIQYIVGKAKTNADREKLGFPLSVIPEYSNLSCYVHGSPGVHALMAELKDEAQVEADLLKTADLALHMATSVKMFSLITFFQYDKSFGAPYAKIAKLVHSLGDKPE